MNKIFILFISFLLKNIICEALPYFKVSYISDYKYYIITFEMIYFYISSPESIEISYQFTEAQMITSERESEMISMGIFKGRSEVAHLIIVKNYLYAIKETVHYCNEKINEINEYSSELFPFKCTSFTCYYIIGFINSNYELNLNLYSNPIGYCNSTLIQKFIINNIDSDTFSCRNMQSPSNGLVLTCFYQDKTTNEIIANNLNIDYLNKKIESLFTQSKSNNGAQIIKSILSQDETKSYICYINNDNNCDCLTYDINTNKFSEITTYISDCLPKKTSLFFDYYTISNEFFLYCFQSTTKINILKLDEYFKVNGQYTNDTYDLIKNCSQYDFSSLVYDTKDIVIMEICDRDLKTQFLGELYEIPTTILTTIPTTILTTIPTTILYLQQYLQQYLQLYLQHYLQKYLQHYQYHYFRQQ